MRILRHNKTLDFYRVLYIAKLELSLEDVVVYIKCSNKGEPYKDSQVWVRPKSEMDDGRFQVIREY